MAGSAAETIDNGGKYLEKTAEAVEAVEEPRSIGEFRLAGLIGSVGSAGLVGLATEAVLDGSAGPVVVAEPAEETAEAD